MSDVHSVEMMALDEISITSESPHSHSMVYGTDNTLFPREFRVRRKLHTVRNTVGNARSRFS